MCIRDRLRLPVLAQEQRLLTHLKPLQHFALDEHFFDIARQVVQRFFTHRRPPQHFAAEEHLFALVRHTGAVGVITGAIWVTGGAIGVVTGATGVSIGAVGVATGATGLATGASLASIHILLVAFGSGVAHTKGPQQSLSETQSPVSTPHVARKISNCEVILAN